MSDTIRVSGRSRSSTASAVMRPLGAGGEEVDLEAAGIA
ncbi:hypothetical protein RKD37_003356 [Streptomyces ambofaciens]